ncbi:hypothetical protein [Leptospira idonii]|uniref:hypothetical protein n=1 Tax=Leptospira idonii TaxID=1193500 RepID=UPI001FE75C17|nr:hypothetical protein [Leptospira idonii]
MSRKLSIRKHILSVLTGILVLFASGIYAQEVAEIKPGSDFPSVSLTDQHDENASITQEIQKILFVSDMDASKIVHKILEKDGDVLLNANQAAFISDIHRMPSLITKFVALPKMKGYSYRMRLIRDDKTGSFFPQNKGSVTLIRLEKGKVVTVDFTNEEEKLKTFLVSPKPNSKK